MLSVKNLVKIYKTKGGVEVRALDGVSVDFPSTGMVFLLGKSGSGKSTLLNVTGGLDVPTEGEVIVKGKSSKDFAPADWDSYRNTYIGFVFQEYNILNEFSVEQNIALALQLQNRDNDKEIVKEILKEVDLEGYEKRKPNTLSGGQKQRVAIARALIKQPEIIMADEPTGALDSETGKQVFDTLKKLSKSRLVIVVSHDRDFAETYADRIIELEDGKVIEDNTRESSSFEEVEENVSVYDNETITVKDWKNISKADIDKIISIMSKTDGETVITKGEKEITEIKKTRKNIKTKKSFRKTEKTDSTYTGEPAKFIKSKLPLVHAFKVAGGAIKEKPIRLAFTILLSILAFTFFGVASTLMLYNPNYSMSTALENSDYSAYIMEKNYQAEYLLSYSQKGVKTTESGGKLNFRGAYSNEDIALLNNNELGLTFDGLIDFGRYSWGGDNFSGPYTSAYLQFPRPGVVGYVDKYYYSEGNVSGFYDGSEQSLKDKGFSLLAGRHPENATEVAISKYHYEFYSKGTSADFTSINDMLGKSIILFENMPLTVVGIYDVGAIPERFDVLKTQEGLDELTLIEKTNLSAELQDYLSCSYHTVAFVSADFYDEYVSMFRPIDYRVCYGMGYASSKENLGLISDSDNITVYTKSSLWQYDEQVNYFDAFGNEIEANLEKDEILIDVKLAFEYVVTSLVIYLDGTPKGEQYADFLAVAKKISSGYVGQQTITKEEIAVFLKGLSVVGADPDIPFNYNGYSGTRCFGGTGKTVEVKVVGFYFIDGSSSSYHPFVNDALIDELAISPWSYEYYQETRYSLESEIDAISQKYGKLIALTDGSYEQAYYILGDFSDYKNAIKNSAYETSSQISRTINTLKVVFSAITLVFAIFASLMLFNFISVSISSKTKEIGILRAIGARGVDVFKIFIIEALIITGICFILSSVASGVICMVINNTLMNTAIAMSILKYGVLSVLMLLAMTLFISFTATLSPVIKASKKSPVDSIRTL